MSRQCNCEHWQQCATCKPKTTPAPVPHKHTKMIKEWADNPSRVVEYLRPWGGWAEIKNPTWCLNIEYRFADEVIPVKPELTCTQTDDAAVWAKEFCERNPSIDEGTMIAWFANAIECSHDLRIKKLADQATPVKPEIVSSLSDDELGHPDEDKPGVLVSPRLIRRAIADAAAKKAYAEGYQAAIDAVCAIGNVDHLFPTYRERIFGRGAIHSFKLEIKKLLGAAK